MNNTNEQALLNFRNCTNEADVHEYPTGCEMDFETNTELSYCPVNKVWVKRAVTMGYGWQYRSIFPGRESKRVANI